ncbi:hypothetical protein [Cohnella nanjingensis]|uniref:Uncharacterized protein n=1 Tax=Cohnella nanjingensis TaxID=1387779 RepID=A0A7X0VJJ7_9BACL|nr:hypothetical protein [Cohnella nanjingensis]MBB6675653.1 hypothetical protein [Cohnella nanjingensis]
MTGFRPMFWGMLFLLDFRINGWDLLPDAVGYGLLYGGLSALSAKSTSFSSGSKLALILMLISLPDLNQSWLGGSPFYFAYQLILIGLHLCMIYSITKGIQELAIIQDRTDLYDAAQSRWRLFLAGCCLTVLMMTGLIAAAPILILVWIFSLITYVLMMELLSRCGSVFVD